MSFRYTPLKKSLKKLYRKLSPIPTSPYTAGAIKDICAVELVPSEDLKHFFARCIQILQKTKDEHIGDYLEFGVFNGSSISSMYLTSKELGLTNTRLFGFDAFEGLPAEAEHEDGGVWKKGFYSCSFETMQECLRQKGINPTDITWIKGWYNETLIPQTAHQYSITNLGIVFVDCDTYSSSKAVLDFIAPLITTEVIICFDDWKLNDLDIKGMGEYKSFNEFLDTNQHLQAKEISSYNRKSRCFLISPI